MLICSRQSPHPGLHTFCTPLRITTHPICSISSFSNFYKFPHNTLSISNRYVIIFVGNALYNKKSSIIIDTIKSKINRKNGGTIMEETIYLKEIFEVIKKRLLLIISCVLGAALIAAVVSFFVLTPTYESSSQFIVNQGEQSTDAQFNSEDIRTNVELINTYNVIIKSNAILDDVSESLN